MPIASFSGRVALLASLSLFTTLSLHGTTANACAPIEATSPYLLFVARHNTTDAAPISVPKNAGLVFQTREYRTAEAAIAASSVEVHAKNELLEGSLRVLGSAYLGFYLQWLPNGATELPVGPLDFKVVSNGEDSFFETITLHETVTVEDRIVELLPSTAAVRSMTRTIASDATAPKIMCRRTPGVGDCSRHETREVSTRAVPFANVEAQMTLHPSINPSDAPYLETDIRIFGRRDGVAGAPTPGDRAQIEGAFDEYCAQATTRSIFDDEELVSEAACTASTVDLSPVAPAEEAEFVRAKLADCEEATYPEGTSAANPTGRVPASDGGCSVTAAAPGSSLGLVAGVIGGLALRRRRTRHWRT